MSIRRAEPADAEEIAVVHVRSWQAAYQGLVPQEYLDHMSPDQRQPGWQRQLAEVSWPRKGVLAVEVEGRIAGFASFCPTRDQDENHEVVGEIAAIYLAPKVWRLGLGRWLMTSTLRTLAQAGYEQATLWVLDTNRRARRFYEATGWRSDGAVKHDDSRGFPLTEVRYRQSIRDQAAHLSKGGHT